MSAVKAAEKGVGYNIATIAEFNPKLAETLKTHDNPEPSRPGIIDSAEYKKLSPEEQQQLATAVDAWRARDRKRTFTYSGVGLAMTGVWAAGMLTGVAAAPLAGIAVALWAFGGGPLIVNRLIK